MAGIRIANAARAPKCTGGSAVLGGGLLQVSSFRQLTRCDRLSFLQGPIDRFAARQKRGEDLAGRRADLLVFRDRGEDAAFMRVLRRYRVHGFECDLREGRCLEILLVLVERLAGAGWDVRPAFLLCYEVCVVLAGCPGDELLRGLGLRRARGDGQRPAPQPIAVIAGVVAFGCDSEVDMLGDRRLLRVGYERGCNGAVRPNSALALLEECQVFVEAARNGTLRTGLLEEVDIHAYDLLPDRLVELRLEVFREVAQLIEQFYAIGVYPDWWKLEPMKTVVGWENAIAAIEKHDAYTRGIVVLGLDAPEAELAASFKVAASYDLVKGFAVGRTIFGDVAREWLKGATDDISAVNEMARRYTRLCEVWDTARRAAREN